MTDTVVLALVSAVSSIASSGLVIINTMITNKIKIQGEANQRKLADTHKAIANLEHSTNGLTEQLVKVTGESEFNRGFKQGEENPR